MILAALLTVLVPPAQGAPPRLFAVIVVDQMRADYLERFGPELKGGLARLSREGAVFTEAWHSHLPTETCPGHAAILTGRHPRSHGIVGNEWWDRELGRETYCAEDPVYGRSPLKLEQPTLGDALKARHPGALVASLSGKDRAAVILGGHRADLALWYDRKAGAYVTSPYYGPLPRWVQAFNRKRPVDAALRDDRPRYYREFLAQPSYDRMLGELAERALAELDLGGDAVPDLLAVSFSATDHTGHVHGPDGPEMRRQILELDAVIGRLLDALDRKVGRGRWAAALTADHGVQPVPETRPDMRRVNVPEAGRRLDEDLHRRFPEAGRDAKWVLGIYPPHVYLDRSLAARTKLPSGRFLSQAAGVLKMQDWVATVDTAEELSGWRGPEAAQEACRLGFHPARAGDLMFTAKPGVVLAWDPTGTEHGSPYDDDARVPLVFWGAGVKPGRIDRPAEVVDLAPTAARLLGLEAFAADGAVLLEVLGEP